MVVVGGGSQYVFSRLALLLPRCSSDWMLSFLSYPPPPLKPSTFLEDRGGARTGPHSSLLVLGGEHKWEGAHDTEGQRYEEKVPMW